MLVRYTGPSLSATPWTGVVVRLPIRRENLRMPRDRDSFPGYCLVQKSFAQMRTGMDKPPVPVPARYLEPVDGSSQRTLFPRRPGKTKDGRTLPVAPWLDDVPMAAG
jgi:hypothetical protein